MCGTHTSIGVCPICMQLTRIIVSLQLIYSLMSCKAICWGCLFRDSNCPTTCLIRSLAFCWLPIDQRKEGQYAYHKQCKGCLQCQQVNRKPFWSLSWDCLWILHESCNDWIILWHFLFFPWYTHTNKQHPVFNVHLKQSRAISVVTGWLVSTCVWFGHDTLWQEHWFFSNAYPTVTYQPKYKFTTQTMMHILPSRRSLHIACKDRSFEQQRVHLLPISPWFKNISKFFWDLAMLITNVQDVSSSFVYLS